MAQLYSGKGAEAAAHVLSVSASTQNRHFQNYIINYLWGILSGHFRHILGTPDTYITYCKKGA